MAGGFSRRMGRDKALLSYHGIPQVLWTYQLLQMVCQEVWVGCRPEQHLGSANDLPRILDREEGRGPIEGIAAALASDADAAWLVVACDLPCLKVHVLEELIEHRDPLAIATVFCSAYDGLPEPLCAIYEPHILSLLEDAISDQRKCPRKILLNAQNRVLMLEARTDRALENFNTPDDVAMLKGLTLSQRK